MGINFAYILKHIAITVLGFGSGVIISGAVFAFIAIIGVVPRLAQRTKTQNQVKLYEEAIILGGVFGTSTDVIDYYLPIGKPLLAVLSICGGIFYGVLAVSLAEVLDMLPILARRAKLQKGMFYFILAIAAGKLVGSLAYAIIPGFYTP